MGRPRKRSIYVVAEATPLYCVGKERVLDLEAEQDDSLADELQCGPADQVLIALRKAFSLTFPSNPFVEGLSQAINEIRRIGVETLIEMPDVLEELGLKPLPRPLQERSLPKAHVFQFSLVREADLHVQVTYKGRRRSLHKLIETLPGDVLVRTLRELVSESFTEMHDEEHFGMVLSNMRSKLWSVLPLYNDILWSIEVEPIAEPPTPQSEAD